METSRGARGRILRWVGLGLVAAGLAAAAVAWRLSCPGGDRPPEADRMATLLPARTPLLVWTSRIDALLGLLRDAGLEGEELSRQQPGFPILIPCLFWSMTSSTAAAAARLSLPRCMKHQTRLSCMRQATASAGLPMNIQPPTPATLRATANPMSPQKRSATG